MSWMKFATLLVTVSVCLGCWPVPKVDQTDYCFADIAYEATIKRGNVDEFGSEYEVDIRKVYKGNAANIPTTLQGFGTMNSCGPQKLDEGATYLIYASMAAGESPRIVKYTGIAYVTDTDRQRMAAYDCSCEIKFSSFFDPLSLPVPTTRDQCNAPYNYCQRSGYCKRSSVGACFWANIGECY
ncbi:uncharacterized protein LOC111115589 isoform X3 [Crassostrea virginica]